MNDICFACRRVLLTAVLPGLLLYGCAAESADQAAIGLEDAPSATAGYAGIADGREVAEEVAADWQPLSDGDRVGRRQRNPGTEKSERDLGGIALEGTGQALGDRERLLEYEINLTYRTRDYRAARQRLIELGATYGYIQNSYATTEPAWSMTTTMRVRTADLYRALRDLDSLGELQSERIDSTDHTEAMAQAERHARRETIRMRRRGAAGLSTPAASKNWAERERLLAESEDRSDASEHEQWQIRDRINFARLSVTLLGPDLPAQIEVPPYEDAFVLLLNGFLHLLFALILVSPLIALAGGLWWKRAALARLFRKRSETPRE